MRKLNGERIYAWLITSALFLEPNPMQLQSACSKDVYRDSLAT